jgi:hypothetical protein
MPPPGCSAGHCSFGLYVTWVCTLLQTWGRKYGSHQQVSISPLTMGPIGCPETSVANYQPTLRKIP